MREEARPYDNGCISKIARVWFDAHPAPRPRRWDSCGVKAVGHVGPGGPGGGVTPAGSVATYGEGEGPRARGRNAGAGGDLHRVEMEDEEIIESVQTGIGSRLYDRGRYSPRRERGTHHFHRLLARFMGGEG